MAVHTERRRYPRAKILYPVTVQTNRQFMVGLTKDISAEGLFICCQNPLKPGEFFEMTISVSPLSPRIKALAEVVWANVSGPDDEAQPRGMGIRFFKMSDEDREVISALVSDNLKSKDINRGGEEPEKE